MSLMADAPSEFLLQKVDELNIMLNADPNAVDWLIKYHVACNEALASTGNVQAALNDHHGPPFFSVGMLGVLNGLLSEPPFYVVADFEEDSVVGFRVMRIDR